MSRERQAIAFDRISNEANRLIVIDSVEGGDDRTKIMAAEIVHQPRQLVVAAALQQCGDRSLIADLIVKPLAPCRSALKHQGRIELVRAIIDPAAQGLAARFGKCRLLKRAVFEQHYVPAEIAEQVLIALPWSLANDGIQTLPVVIDDPPAIAQPLFPA